MLNIERSVGEIMAVMTIVIVPIPGETNLENLHRRIEKPFASLGRLYLNDSCLYQAMNCDLTCLVMFVDETESEKACFGIG